VELYIPAVVLLALLPLRWRCFHACWLIGLSLLTRLLKKLWMNVHKIWGRGRVNRLHFGGDLCSDLVPGILFLLHLFAVFKNCATLLMFARCQHYNAGDFSDEASFSIVYRTKLQTTTYSLAEV